MKNMGKKSNAKKEKKEEAKKTILEMPEKSEQLEQPQKEMRQIIIETDGSNVNIIKAEVSNLELQAILANLLRKITSN